MDFADPEHRIEIRRATPVKMLIADLWAKMGQSCLFVTRHEQFPLYLMLGGNALISEEILTRSAPDWLDPYECYPASWTGFIKHDPKNSQPLRRAPTPKLRMQVLKRDSRRCKICGRSPNDHTDVFLEVHHIRPWGARGVTTVENLITLCKTCHDGLEPHYDQSLHALIDQPLSAKNYKHDADVLRFRTIAKKALDDAREE